MFCNGSIFHHWSNWKVHDEGPLVNRKTYGGKPVEGSERCIGYVLHQKRECAVCGLIQLRIETAKL